MCGARACSRDANARERRSSGEGSGRLRRLGGGEGHGAEAGRARQGRTRARWRWRLVEGSVTRRQVESGADSRRARRPACGGPARAHAKSEIEISHSAIRVRRDQSTRSENATHTHTYTKSTHRLENRSRRTLLSPRASHRTRPLRLRFPRPTAPSLTFRVSCLRPSPSHVHIVTDHHSSRNTSSTSEPTRRPSSLRPQLGSRLASAASEQWRTACALHRQPV